jgi:hypothetical protein
MYLINERTNKAEAEKKQAEATRGRKVSHLQKLQQLLEKVLEHKVPLPIFLKAWNYDSEPDLCRVLWELYHKARGINVELALLRTDVPDLMPDDLKEIYDYILSIPYDSRTADPSKYWDENKKRFVPLALTAEEKQLIEERNKQYSKSEEMKRLYDFTKNFVDLYNEGFTRYGVKMTRTDIEKSLPWLAPWVRRPRRPSPDFEHQGVSNDYRIEVDEKRFFFNDLEGKTIFDE